MYFIKTHFELLHTCQNESFDFFIPLTVKILLSFFNPHDKIITAQQLNNYSNVEMKQLINDIDVKGDNNDIRIRRLRLS